MSKLADTGNVTVTVTTPDVKTGVQAPPKFVRPNFERMPPELKLSKNWLIWGAVWNGSKCTKRTINRVGEFASAEHVPPTAACKSNRGVA